MEKPKRKFVLTLTVSADDKHELIRALQAIAADLRYGSIEERHGSSDIGKLGHSFNFTVDHNPEMDHDRYDKDLSAWEKEHYGG